MADAGLIVLVALISPLRAEREAARARIGKDLFLEVFVDVSLAVAEARDPKGLYRKAREGLLPNLTGVGSPYEAPIEPELHIHGDTTSPEAASQAVLDLLLGRDLL
jgi:bifunctional enzyme CysN/CysC